MTLYGRKYSTKKSYVHTRPAGQGQILGLKSNGKLGERAFAGPCAGAPDISWPQVGMEPHSLLSNHGQATISARLGCTRACSAAVGAKAVSTFAGVKFYIFTAGQIRCSKYMYLPRIMAESYSMCRKRNMETSRARSVPQIIGSGHQMGHQ